jgi:hypothetical protein
MRLNFSRRPFRWGRANDSIAARTLSPSGLAASFAILATITSVVAAHFEGRLTTAQVVALSGVSATSVIPFSRNLSTLVDFLILDPLVIYFLLRCRIEWRAVDRRLKFKEALSPYHRAGLATVCVLLGIYAMKFYVEGSIFYDATLIPGVNSRPAVTITGWIVYSWTAAYIALVLFAVTDHGLHVAQLLTLSKSDISYAPFHPDRAGGVRFLMQPSLTAGYAMICLLATFVVFVIHDRWLYHIESNRLVGFGIYIIVALPLFVIPFWKLHELMKFRRDEYLFDSLDQTLAEARVAGDRKDWAALAGCVAAIESADKYKKLVSTFPVWPVPLALTLPPLSSIAAAAAPFVQKAIFSSASSGLLPG